jgi:hypothetical protein
MSFANLLPGQGLGFTGSKLIAFGLGAMVSYEISQPPIYVRGGGSGGGGIPLNYKVFDNAYSRKNDDDEILEILSIYFGVIE